MKNIKCLTRILVPVALLCGSSIASAAESGFYVGINIGEAQYEPTEDVEGPFFPVASTSLIDRATTWNLQVGYQFNKFLGVELSYVDLGSLKFSEAGVVSSAPLQTGTYDLEASVSGLGLALTAAIPIGGFDIHAKLGGLNAKTEINEAFRSQTTSPYPALLTNTDSTTTFEVMYGVGVGYTVGQYHLSIDWTGVPAVGDEEETGEADVTAVTLGVSYTF